MSGGSCCFKHPETTRGGIWDSSREQSKRWITLFGHYIVKNERERLGVEAGAGRGPHYGVEGGFLRDIENPLTAQ